MDIGIRPATLLNITMAEYTFTTQGSLKNIFQGLCKEKKIQNSHQVCVLYSHKNYPDYCYTSMPSYPHPKIPPYPYKMMSPHPICLCTYCTSSPVYAPYGVARHTCIKYLGYLHRLPPSNPPPRPCCKTYFLLICILIPQGG